MTGAAVRMTSGCIFSVRCNVTRPVSEMLEACQNGMWLHMPGHGGKAPFGPVDMTELDLFILLENEILYGRFQGIIIFKVVSMIKGIIEQLIYGHLN